MRGWGKKGDKTMSDEKTQKGQEAEKPEEHPPVASMPLLSLPDNILKEIIDKVIEIANKSYPDIPRFFFERRRIRNECIGEKIMARISIDG